MVLLPEFDGPTRNGTRVVLVGPDTRMSRSEAAKSALLKEVSFLAKMSSSAAL